jgi:hypothetical protein
MRPLGLALLFILSLAPQALCMTDEERRDYLAFCMASGTFRFEDPGIRDSISGAVARGGSRSIELEPLFRLFSDSDRLKIIDRVQACAQEIARVSSYQVHQARVNTREQVSADLYLTIRPEEYTAAMLCKRPDILFDFRLAKQLMAGGGGALDPKLKVLVDSLLQQTYASIGVNPLTLDFDNLRCEEARLCELRGSIPIEVMSEQIAIYQVPSRQIRVLAGNCQGKVGYVNERFIDF